MAGFQPQVLSGYTFYPGQALGRFPTLPKNFARRQVPQEPQRRKETDNPVIKKYKFGQTTDTL
ncbi:hypothetical protein ACIOMR_30750, partial [Pseudomonas sp. NPDC087814]|uniref:hypothetical protein n=1 Tax=Pseudomonas sp. NPDC087814 TaxID=3364450 RepID=UPI00382C2A71